MRRVVIAIPTRLVVVTPVRTKSTKAVSPGKSKVWASADDAVKDIKSGSVILSGGRDI